MPHVSVHYKVYLRAGHHRQPRNQSSQLEPGMPNEVDVTPNTQFTPAHLPQLPYDNNGQAGLAQLLFWSVTDGSVGHTFPAGPLTQPVGSNGLTITAWYFPVGGGGGTDTAIIDDAFSAVKGDFIDDTFVTVLGDPSLTEQANVVGIVPTSQARTLEAHASVVSTPEPFSKWLAFEAGSASGKQLNVPALSNGFAIAVYERPEFVFPGRIDEAIGGTIIGGVAVDGGGAIVIGGKPHPVDPWGPLMLQLRDASLASAAARGLSREVAGKVRSLAAESVRSALRGVLQKMEKSGK